MEVLNAFYDQSIRDFICKRQYEKKTSKLGFLCPNYSDSTTYWETWPIMPLSYPLFDEFHVEY